MREEKIKTFKKKSQRKHLEEIAYLMKAGPLHTNSLLPLWQLKEKLQWFQQQATAHLNTTFLSFYICLLTSEICLSPPLRGFLHVARGSQGRLLIRKHKRETHGDISEIRTWVGPTYLNLTLHKGSPTPAVYRLEKPKHHSTWAISKNSST